MCLLKSPLWQQSCCLSLKIIFSLLFLAVKAHYNKHWWYDLFLLQRFSFAKERYICDYFSPSQRNMSHTRSTEAHGRVREKAHMNHSVMYKMGSSLCFFRWRWATGDTRRSSAYRISPSSWIASCGDDMEQQLVKREWGDRRPSLRLIWLSVYLITVALSPPHVIRLLVCQCPARDTLDWEILTSPPAVYYMSCCHKLKSYIWIYVGNKSGLV